MGPVNFPVVTWCTTTAAESLTLCIENDYKYVDDAELGSDFSPLLPMEVLASVPDSGVPPTPKPTPVPPAPKPQEAPASSKAPMPAPA